MSQPCSVCSHPRRSTIEVSLLAQAPIQVVAQEHRVGLRFIERHKKVCLPKLLSRRRA
jgi:hypothetical protein